MSSGPISATAVFKPTSKRLPCVERASFTAAFDHQAQAPAGGPYTLTGGGSQIVNRALATNDPEPLEQRGLLGFDLSSLPNDALITSAFLDFQVAGFVPGSKAEGFSTGFDCRLC